MGFSKLTRAALGVLLLGLSLTVAQARIYIADGTRNEIRIFANNATGNEAPTYIISGAATGLNDPTGVAVDANYIYVANTGGNSITKYNLNANGNVAPVATIGGGATAIQGPAGLAVDANYIYVANAAIETEGGSTGSILFFPINSTGNVAPTLAMAGTFSTGTTYAVATNANYIFCVNSASSVTGMNGVGIWDRTNPNAVSPTYFLSSPTNTIPYAIAIDANNFYVTARSSGGDTVQTFPLAGLSNATMATNTIIGASTLLDGPEGIAVDANYIYVRNILDSTITTYPLATNGNNPPTDNLGGTNSIITASFTMAVDGTSVPAATHFSISAAATQFAGSSATFTIAALDSTNTVVPSYNGTVHFTSTDPLAVLPADMTLTSGVSPSFTPKTSGSQTITATDTVTPAITGTSNTFSVTPGSDDHLGLTVPSTATANTPFNVVVTVYDQYGNVATGSGSYARFSSTDPSAVLPSSSPNFFNGTATVSVTLVTPGSQTISAHEQGSTTIIGTSSAIVVSGGALPATHFSVSIPGTATAGTSVNAVVTALDSTNATVTGYAGTVAFSSTDGSAVLPANTTLTGGTGTVAVTFKTAGSQTLTATDTVTASITGTSSTLTVSAAAVTRIAVSTPGTATAGSAVNATVTGYDTYGNVATSYTGTVHFASTDTGATLPANTTLVAGTKTVAVTFATAGNQTLTATDTVTPALTATSAATTVSAGAATHFTVSIPGTTTAGTAFNVVVTAYDASNNIANGYTGTVHLTSTDTGAVLSPNFTLINGARTGSATFHTSGSQTITATDTVTGTITGTSATSMVSPGAATHLTVTAPGTATAGTGISVVVTALDTYGNTATGYTGSVQFSSTDGSAIVPATTPLPSGTRTVTVTLQTPGSQTITATDTVTNTITGTSAAVVVSAAPVVATHFSVSAPGTATTGSAISVVVTALSATNATVTGYTGTVHFTSSDTAATLPANATLTGGTGTFSVTLQTTGSQTVTATDTVTTTITGTSSGITVSAPAAPATHFSVSAPGTVAAGAAPSVVVTALTATNATATGYTGTVHFTSSDTAATLPANATLTGGQGTFSATFRTVGTQTITATDTVSGTITGTSGSITVNHSAANVTLAGLNQTYTGAPLPVTATSAPAVASIIITYNNSNTVPTNAGTYSVVATVSDPNYTGSATGTLTIAQASQTIVFSPITAVVNVPVTLTATASSGLAVTFAIQSGHATITGGNTLTCLDTNPVTVVASQAGDSNHLAATSVTQSVTAAAAGGVGVGGIGGAGGTSADRRVNPDASGTGGSIAVSVNGTSGTMIGYISSLSAGFTANFTLSGTSFTTTATTLTGTGGVGQSLTITGTVASGVVSGTIAPLGLPFSVTLDPTTGTTSGLSGVYQAAGSVSGSVSYSIVGTQGEVFVLAVTPSGVAAGTGSVSSSGSFSVTTSQGTTIAGSINSSTAALSETVTPAGGTAVTFNGASSVASPTVAPATQSVACGGTATLAVTTSASSPTYQWLFNGTPIAGATSATLSIPLIGFTQAGTYSAVVISGGTSTTSNAASVTVTSNAWLSDISTRASVAPATSAVDVLTAGFITTGPGAKQLLMRAAGPALSAFGITGFLPNPSLTINAGGVASVPVIGWSSSLASVFSTVGAFPFAAGSADAAVLNTYNSGAFTAVVTAADAKQSGVAIVEVYDADHLAPGSRLINLSSLAFSGTGTGNLVGGFVISGTTSETVLIRAVGPRLAGAPFSLPGVLAQPVLQIYDTNSSGNRIIAQIQGWGSQPTAGTSTVAASLQPATAGVMASVGAFALTSGSADSALVLVLPPGAYTAQVSGANSGTGMALVEIYEVP